MEAAGKARSSATLIGRLLPVEVTSAERFADIPGDIPWPGEDTAVARAVRIRRAEFVTGRACAREALVALGREPVAIGTGPQREPLWPAGTLGSITHCTGYRAAAVALSGGRIRSLGIDGEPAAPLPADVVPTIVSADEPYAWRDRTVDAWDRLVFSAKESLYKAWFPLHRSWLGFDEVCVRPGVADGELLVEPRSDDARRGLAGLTIGARYLVEGGLILTAVVLS